MIRWTEPPFADFSSRTRLVRFDLCKSTMTPWEDPSMKLLDSSRRSSLLTLMAKFARLTGIPATRQSFQTKRKNLSTSAMPTKKRKLNQKNRSIPMLLTSKLRKKALVKMCLLEHKLLSTIPVNCSTELYSTAVWKNSLSNSNLVLARSSSAGTRASPNFK